MAALAAAIVAGVVLAGFVASLMILPSLTGLSVVSPAAAVVARRTHGAERALLNYIAHRERRPVRAVSTAGAPIAGAWFAPWEDGALDSFTRHAGDLTHVYPTWIELRDDGGDILTKDWDPARNPTTKPLIAAARVAWGQDRARGRQRHRGPFRRRAASTGCWRPPMPRT